MMNINESQNEVSLIMGEKCYTIGVQNSNRLFYYIHTEQFIHSSEFWSLILKIKKHIIYGAYFRDPRNFKRLNIMNY